MMKGKGVHGIYPTKNKNKMQTPYHHNAIITLTFLKSQIEQMTDVALVDPGAAVARQVRRVLPSSLHTAAGINRYFTSGSPEQLQAMLKGLIGVEAEVALASL